MRTGTAGERFYGPTDVSHDRVRIAMAAAGRRTHALPLDALGITGHRLRRLLETQADLEATFTDDRKPMPRRTLKPEDHTMPMARPVALVAHDYGPHVEPPVDVDNPPVVEYRVRWSRHTAPVSPTVAAQRATINQIAHRQAQEAYRP